MEWVESSLERGNRWHHLSLVDDLDPGPFPREGKMRTRLAFLVCVVAAWLAVTCTQAQGRNIFVEACGGADSEVSRCLIETENGDFIVTGYHSDGTDRDVLLARYDGLGIPRWHIVYGGGEDDEGYSVVETSSGDLVLVGYTRSHGDGADFLISKFNSSGDPLWSRYWGNNQGEDEELSCVIEAEDGNLWATGYTRSFAVQSRPKVLVARISPTGTTLNCARAGKLLNDWGLVGVSIAEVFGAYPGFCVTGSFTDPGLLGCGKQILLAKFDHGPNYLWAYRIGESGDCQEGTAIVRTDDACLALAGNTEWFDDFYGVWVDGGFVLKTDPEAQLDWALRDHGVTFYQGLRVWDLWQTQDDGLVATGVWHDPIWGDVEDGIFLTKWSFAGTELWNRSFEGGHNSVAHSGTETQDSCLMTAGATEGYGSGGSDLLLALCRSDGTTCLPESGGPGFSDWSPSQNSIVLVDASWDPSTSEWYPVPFHTVPMDTAIICSPCAGVDDHVATMSLEFKLHSSMPNPFNPRTEIRFDLPEPVPVQLLVYDVQGRLVRTLESGLIKNAGRHVSVWDGLDERGLAVSSGVYFYRLEAGDFVETKRMTLVK